MNKSLDLEGGWHVGPLFVIRKRRESLRGMGTRAPGTLRRRCERRRTPSWADRAAMAAMYREARRLTRITGQLHVVDHVVPLVGKYSGKVIVSGLHWEGNMRVITAKENSDKREWHWPDAPFEQLELFAGIE